MTAEQNGSNEATRDIDHLFRKSNSSALTIDLNLAIARSSAEIVLDQA